MGVNPYAQYHKNQVETADQGKLLLMLYEGALRFLGRARRALREHNAEAANNNLVRTQEIIAELMASLNLEAGDVAVSLFRLYEYMHYLLVQANIRKDEEMLDQVEGMLLELKEAWSSALGMGVTVPPAGQDGEDPAVSSLQNPEEEWMEGRQTEEKVGALAGYQPGLREEEALKQGYRRVNMSG